MMEQQLRDAMTALDTHPDLPRPGSMSFQCYTNPMPVAFTFAGMAGLRAVAEWARAYGRPVQIGDWFDLTLRVQAQSACGPITLTVPWLDRRDVADLPWPDDALAVAVHAAHTVNEARGAQRHADRAQPVVEPADVLAALGGVLTHA